MISLSERSYNMAETLRFGAKDLPESSYPKRMAKWWEHMATLHARREKLRSTHIIPFVLVFPYWVHQHLKLDREVMKWDKEFDKILMKHAPNTARKLC